MCNLLCDFIVVVLWQYMTLWFLSPTSMIVKAATNTGNKSSSEAAGARLHPPPFLPYNNYAFI